MANITGRQKIVLEDKFIEGTGAENFTDEVNSTIETFLTTLDKNFN